MAQQGTTPQIALPQVKGPAVLAGYSEEQGGAAGDHQLLVQRYPLA